MYLAAVLLLVEKVFWVCQGKNFADPVICTNFIGVTYFTDNEQ